MLILLHFVFKFFKICTCSKKKKKKASWVFSPVTVKLQVSGHFTVRNSVWGFLQAESLEINADAPVWDDEVRVHGALHPTCILTVVTLPQRT